MPNCRSRRPFYPQRAQCKSNTFFMCCYLKVTTLSLYQCQPVIILSNRPFLIYRHTLTETLSRIVSIWFRNERIPTTLYSTTTALVTEYVTLTSTLIGTHRQRRDIPYIESSMDDSEHQFPIIRKTETQSSTLASNNLLGFLAKPRVMEAWSNFLEVLREEVAWRYKYTSSFSPLSLSIPFCYYLQGQQLLFIFLKNAFF